jgi:Ca2+:H+ antiporter
VSDVVSPRDRQVDVAVFYAIRLVQLLGEATDQLSIELGQTLGALLNASFGNAVEIIVGIAALLQG